MFWKKASNQLADWAKIIEKIEKGEKKIARNREIREALETKVSVCARVRACVCVCVWACACASVSMCPLSGCAFA